MQIVVCDLPSSAADSLSFFGERKKMYSNSVILIAVEDPVLRYAMITDLKDKGFSFLEASSGISALDQVRSNGDVDLALIEDSYADISGLDVCRSLRSFSYLPILYLSHDLDLNKKLDAYAAGADDILEVPYQKDVFLSKLESLLRRYLVYRGKIIEFHGIQIDHEKRIITKNGTPLDLTDLELNILEYMFTQKGKVVSIQDIYENVWGEKFFSQSSNTVMVHILNLRKKLEDDTSHPRIIRTVWGKGYKLCV